MKAIEPSTRKNCKRTATMHFFAAVSRFWLLMCAYLAKSVFWIIHFFFGREKWTHRASRWNWGWNGQLKTWMNWHNTQIVSPHSYDFPHSNEDILNILEEAAAKGQKIKVVGSGCSPNSMAVCRDRLIFMDKMNKILTIDGTFETVRVQTGVTFKKLNEVLAEFNLGLSVLTSISEPTVGGALATAIHGTGCNFGCVSHYAVALQLITSTGRVLECSKNNNKEIFKASLCHLGGLGIITEVTLKVEKAYKLRAVQKEVSLTNLLSNLNERMSSNEHWRFWYFPHTDMCSEWMANRVPMTTPNATNWSITKFRIFNDILESALFLANYFPWLNRYINRVYRYITLRNESITVDRSDKVFNFDCLFRQYVNEWSIPQAACKSAITQIKEMINKNRHWGIHFPIEIRFSKGDDIWLSPAYGRDTCWIGIIMYRPWNAEPPAYWKEYFKGFEKIMFALNGRPHWAKEFDLDYNQLKELYPKFEDWVKMQQSLDPSRLFVNEFLERLISRK